MNRDRMTQNVKKWDEIFRAREAITIYPHEFIIVWYRRVVSNIPFDSSKPSVLDIGCGGAADLQFFLDNNFFYTGIDVTDKLFRQIKERYNKFKNRFKLRTFMPPALPFKEGAFDIVIGINSIHFNSTVKSMKMMLNEVRRVLKQGGHFFFTVFDSHHFLIESGFVDFLKGFTFKVNNRYYDRKRAGTSYFFFRDKAEIEKFFNKFSDVHIGRYFLDMNDGKQQSEYVIYGRK